MPSKKPAILIHAEKEILDKIKYIAKENERSTTQEIIYIIKRRIKEYESDNGEISQTVINNGTMEIGIQNNTDKYE